MNTDTWLPRALAAAIAALAIGCAVAVPTVLLDDDAPAAPRDAEGDTHGATTTSEVTTTSTIVSSPQVATTRTTLARRPLVCRNSVDPRCGPFRWDPPVAPNQPLSATFTMTPSHPRTGQEVTFAFDVVDPDAAPIYDSTCGLGDGFQPIFGDNTPSGPYCGSTCHGDRRTGPWTPPDRQRGQRSFRYRHAYANAGTFTAQFTFESAYTPCEKHPYANKVTPVVTVAVEGEPAATPTTTTAVPA